MVGPNNCGKSTIIGALRILAAGLRRANSRRPEILPIRGNPLGYPVSAEDVPVSLENVHTDYSDEESSIRFNFSNQNYLTLLFPGLGGCYLLPETSGSTPRTVDAFRRFFPVSIATVPVLGPVEHNEELVQPETVTRYQYSHRASRHFRSYWYYNPEGFAPFAELIRTTWPGMEIMPPERADLLAGTLAMFCKEKRIDRELYWAGFGFQVWCQMLTHVARSADCTILAIDEPEIYLHPGVQRQLMSLLREVGPDVLIATHSTEMIAEADPSDILLIDKSLRSARRLTDISEVQAALEQIGSIQNITLTQLARSRKVVFVENQHDFTLIRRFAERAGLTEVATGGELTPVDSEGSTTWMRIGDVAWGIERTLGDTLRIAAVFDRDYRSREEAEAIRSDLGVHLVFCHIHQRKEIENYLLDPLPLQRALERAVRERANRQGESPPPVGSIGDLLEELTAGHRDKARSQYVARRVEYLRRSGRDTADLTAETIEWFDSRWSNLGTRLEIMPGKAILKELRQRIQTDYGVTLTDYRIIGAFHKNDLSEDMLELLNALRDYHCL